MVQYTNILIASALVASALPSFAAPVAGVNIEARSGVAKAVIDHSLDAASRSTLTQPLKKSAKEQAKKNPPRTNTVGFANSKYAKDTKSAKKREFDDEMMELLEREVNIEARSGVAKAVIDHALDSASRYTLTQPLKKTAKPYAKKVPPRTNTVGFANSKYAKDTKSAKKREFDDEMMELLEREVNIEARSGVAKAVIDHSLDAASRSTLTQPLKKSAKEHAKKNPPRTNTVGFANSKYVKDTKSSGSKDTKSAKKREFDDEMMELLERELFDMDMDIDY